MARSGDTDPPAITDERPRVLATQADFDRAADLIDADRHAESWYGNVRTHADRLFDERLVADDVPENLSAVRRVTGRLWRLAFMYRHTGEARYADRAWDAIETVAALDDWYPQAFLRTAELGAGVATVYDWCHDHWSPAQRETIVSTLESEVLVDAVRGYHRSAEGAELDDRTWWIECSHNWNTVCNGGVAMTAVAIAGDTEDRALVADALEGAHASISRPLEALGDDGGWGEGPVYWGYMSRYLAFYLITLEAATGGIPDELAVPGLATTGYFPIYTLGDERTFNFGDAGPIKLNAPQLFWLGDRYDRSALAGYQQAMLGVGNPIGEPYRDRTGNTGGANDWGVLDLLWYRPEQVEPVDSLPLDRVFEDVAVATFRDSWTPGMRFVGVKGGDSRINHSHLDLGSFVFDALGTRWACDLGGDDYSLEGYFGDGRWEYYRLRTEGHNTLVLNPSEGPNQPTTATASIDSHGGGADAAYAIVNLSKAYPDAAESVRRGVALLEGRAALLVRDELVTPDPIEFHWFMHTAADVTIDGRTATLARDGERLRLTVRDPPGATFTVSGATPLPDSPVHEDQANNEGVSRIEVRAEAVRDPTCTVVLDPLDGRSGGIRPSPDLADWSVDSLSG